MSKAVDWDDGSASSDAATSGLTHSYKVHYPRTADPASHTMLKEADAVAKNYTQKITGKYSKRTFLDWLVAIIPIFGWLPKYEIKAWLISDLAAGLSVAAMVVPQGLSYAKLAGLPSVWGLYGAFVPCIIYGLFGSSKQLAVGPVAVTSLLLGSNLADVAGVTFPATVFSTVTNKTVPYNPNTPFEYAPQQTLYNNAAHNVTFLAGLMYTIVGLLRLGWITQYLSQPVISGFMAGASITIASSQVKYMMGLKVPRYNTLQATIQSLAENLTVFSWREYIMGMSFLIILEVFKYVGRKHRRLFFFRALGPITVTILSIAIMNIFKLYQPGKAGPNGIYTVGIIPSGLPPYTGNLFFPFVGSVKKTFTLAIVVCLVDITESISIARALAVKNKYELQPTQELLAIGYANIAGSLFNSYTTTGSFSRSAVNDSCGAKTPLATIFSGFTVMVVLLALTEVFTNMPNNAQGAIIISGVITFFDYKENLFLWKVNKIDWLIWMIAFLAVLFAGVEDGIAISVGLSFAVILFKIGFPHTATLGRLPGTQVFRNLKQYPGARTIPGVLVVQIDAPFYFASVQTIRDMFVRYTKRAEADANAVGGRLQFIVVELTSVAEIDATAVHYLYNLVRTNRDRRLMNPITNEEESCPVTVLFANPSIQVVRQFEKADLVSFIGPENIYVDISDAVSSAEGVLLSNLKVSDHTEA